MASRDLTRHFVTLRAKQKPLHLLSDETDTNDLLRNQSSSTADWRPPTSTAGGVLGGNENMILPPIWVDLVDQIDDDLSQTTKLMAQLSSLHGSRVNSVFLSERELTSRDRDIDNLTNEITGKFKHAEGLIRRIGKTKAGESSIDAKVRSNIMTSTAKRLQGKSMEFRKQQKIYLDDVVLQKGGGVKNDDQFGINNEKKGGNGGSTDEYNDGFTMQQLSIVDDLSNVVNERDEEINKIAKSIEELSTIFKELAVLVIDQGTILDRIDFNMEQVVASTTEGIKQLEKAESHQKSARPLKCIIGLLLLIGIMLTILVLKHT